MNVKGGGFGSVGGGPSAGGAGGTSSGISLLSATSLESGTSFESKVVLLLEKLTFEAKRFSRLGPVAVVSATVKGLSACAAGVRFSITERTVVAGNFIEPRPRLPSSITAPTLFN